MFMSAAQYKQFRQKGTRKVAGGTRAVLTENEIQNEIRERLRWAGWYVIRHQQSMGSLKGLSDLSAIRNGQTVYIEVKKPGGVQSRNETSKSSVRQIITSFRQENRATIQKRRKLRSFKIQRTSQIITLKRIVRLFLTKGNQITSIRKRII